MDARVKPGHDTECDASAQRSIADQLASLTTALS
jgi:hypothetical protein